MSTHSQTHTFSPPFSSSSARNGNSGNTMASLTRKTRTPSAVEAVENDSLVFVFLVMIGGAFLTVEASCGLPDDIFFSLSVLTRILAYILVIISFIVWQSGAATVQFLQNLDDEDGISGVWRLGSDREDSSRIRAFQNVLIAIGPMSVLILEISLLFGTKLCFACIAISASVYLKLFYALETSWLSLCSMQDRDFIKILVFNASPLIHQVDP
eukprot:jgi/Bigna1/74749/fgenesh1_pg.30_\